MSTAVYDTERRSHAAKMGWILRKMQPIPPTPISLARGRLRTLAEAIDPVTARLYACDAAEAVLHHYEEHYPGDPGAAQAIAAARRLARGELTTWGHRKAWAAARAMASRPVSATGRYRTDWCCAAQAATWCLDRDAVDMLYWAAIWAALCGGFDQEVGALRRHIAALEALMPDTATLAQ